MKASVLAVAAGAVDADGVPALDVAAALDTGALELEAGALETELATGALETELETGPLEVEIAFETLADAEALEAEDTGETLYAAPNLA